MGSLGPADVESQQRDILETQRQLECLSERVPAVRFKKLQHLLVIMENLLIWHRTETLAD